MTLEKAQKLPVFLSESLKNLESYEILTYGERVLSDAFEGTMQANIAFFDSGQGGLTVWESVIKRFPTLNTNYLGDNARHPYGNKGAETVTRYTSEALLYLLSLKADFVVVACGTASSVAVETLKHVFRVPIVGVVEGLCEAAVSAAKPNSTIAILGTRFTVASGRFEVELKRLGAKKIWQRACPLFVPLVEEGVTPGPMADAAADLYLHDIPQDVGIVVLGCTHYPRLARSIAESLFRKTNRTILYKSAEGEVAMCETREKTEPITLVDSSLGIVTAVEKYLGAAESPSIYMNSQQNFFCSDAPERFREVAKLFTQRNLPNVNLVRLGT